MEYKRVFAIFAGDKGYEQDRNDRLIFRKYHIYNVN